MSSCHGCADKFGFLKKEYGCPKCGFSYCKKCLRFGITDPKTSKQLQVCNKCHAMASTTKEPLAVINALQRLESMDDPAKHPIVVYQQQARKPALQELRKGLSVEDQHILERLESLKKDDAEDKPKRRSSEQMEEEIAERLARLKGEEYDPSRKNRPLNLRNIKPETEEDIIAKFTAEVEMDSKYEAGVVNDIEERLARLRGETSVDAGAGAANRPSTSSQATAAEQDFEELSEEDQVKLIMKQLQDELELEKKTGSVSVGSSEMDVDQTEQPENVPIPDSDDDIDADELCGICGDKRATLICKECDDDIYCKACFQELHRELGEMHAPKAFKLKK